MIFVAAAATVPLRNVFEVVGTIVGPFRSALLVCHAANC
jgi:hypothetical protein